MILLQNVNNGRAVAYFNLDMGLDQKILNWLESNLESLDELNLTEAYNCTVTYNDNIFTISGDNDLVYLEVFDLSKKAITL